MRYRGANPKDVAIVDAGNPVVGLHYACHADYMQLALWGAVEGLNAKILSFEEPRGGGMSTRHALAS